MTTPLHVVTNLANEQSILGITSTTAVINRPRPCRSAGA